MHNGRPVHTQKDPLKATTNYQFSLLKFGSYEKFYALNNPESVKRKENDFFLNSFVNYLYKQFLLYELVNYEQKIKIWNWFINIQEFSQV